MIAPVLLAATILAQVPYIETLEVRVHGVDVVVTDAKGKPVPGLTQDDFQLFEDGRPQQITNFTAFAAKATAPPSAASTPAVGTPPAVTEEKRAPRKFIFYVDEMSLDGPTNRKLRAELTKLIDSTMEAGDEAMLLRPAEEKKLTTPFSSDRAAVKSAVLKAVEEEKWRNNAPILRELRLLENEMRGVTTDIGTRVAARRWAGIVRSRVQQRLGQLRAVVNAAGEVQGRKVLVLITESLPMEPGSEAFTAFSDVISAPSAGGAPLAANDGSGNSSTPGGTGAGVAFGDWTNLPVTNSKIDWVSLKPLIEEIGRTAATNGVTIYSLQAAYGMELLAPGADIGATMPGRDAINPAQQRQAASVARLGGYGKSKMVEHMGTNTEASLKSLADMTGGTWHKGGLSIDNLIGEISSDVQTYYSLGYRASEGMDTPHKIEVRVKNHPGLHVRTRQEVVRKSAEREMTDRVVATLLVPSAANELGIRLEKKQVGIARDGQYKTVYVAARVPLSTLTFLPVGDKLVARFSVHYAATGTESDFVSGMHGEQVVEVPAAKFDEVRNDNWTYVVPMNLRPAKHTVAIGVLDSVSHLSGFGKIELDLR